MPATVAHPSPRPPRRVLRTTRKVSAPGEIVISAATSAKARTCGSRRLTTRPAGSSRRVWSFTIPDGLHEGVADRRADEAEAAALQLLAERVGKRRPRRELLRRANAVAPGSAADEIPQEPVEAAELALDLQECAPRS